MLFNSELKASKGGKENDLEYFNEMILKPQIPKVNTVS